MYFQMLNQHEDFRGNRNPPTARNINFIPQFRVVKWQVPRFVLVLDVSGSMSTNDRIGRLGKVRIYLWLQFNLKIIL